MTQITVDTYDHDGAYVVVAEWANQAPIVMETEGDNSSLEAAQKRVEGMKHITRYSICRLVPVRGTNLVVKDLERLQK